MGGEREREEKGGEERESGRQGIFPFPCCFFGFLQSSDGKKNEEVESKERKTKGWESFQNIRRWNVTLNKGT